MAMTIVIMYLIFSMLAVIYYDATRYIIPNWLVASLLVIYPLAVYLSPHAVDWKMALAGMAIIFAAGYFVFYMKWMGAGDIKLMTVCALWVGFTNLLEYVFMVAVLGGVISVVLFLARPWVPHVMKSTAEKPLPRLLRKGSDVPYGLAISVVFLAFLWMGRLPLISMHGL
jgi:prepilin peptidase CpaA